MPVMPAIPRKYAIAITGLLTAAVAALGLWYWLHTYLVQRPGHFAQLTSRMAVPRSLHTATDLSSTFGGNVLIAGGRSSLGQVLNSAELFDTEREVFVFTGPMRHPRFFHQGVAYSIPNHANAEVYIFGGFSSDNPAGPASALVEHYDPATGVFSDAGNLVTPRVYFGVAVIGAAQFLVVGGVPDNTSPPMSSAEVFNFGTSTSQSVGPMVRARSSATVVHLLTGATALVTGDAAVGDLYHATSQSFTPTVPSRTGRRGHTATRLRDGRVLIVGGADPSRYANSVCVAEAEMFDPTSGTYAQVGVLGVPRFDHTATLLGDGRVLIAGGRSCSSLDFTGIRSAELFDPVAGTFALTGNLVTGRWGHTATWTNTGKVLIAGGESGSSVFSSAEVYIPPL